MKKIVKILLISFVIIVALINVTRASIISDIFKQSEEWINTGKEQPQETMTTANQQEINDVIYNILFVVAVCVAVIVGAILGIKIMISGIEEKAEAKEALPVYVISCVITFGAFGIWKVMIQLLGSI